MKPSQAACSVLGQRSGAEKDQLSSGQADGQSDWLVMGGEQGTAAAVGIIYPNCLCRLSISETTASFDSNLMKGEPVAVLKMSKLKC